MASVASAVQLSTEVAAAAVFVGLAVLAIRAALRGTGGNRWAAAAFGALATVLVAVPVLGVLEVQHQLVSNVLGLLLLAFPYLLLGFTDSFRPLRRWVAVGAAVAAGGVMVASVVVPAIQERLSPTMLTSYVAAVALYWVVLSAVTVVRLWRAGRGQPTLARRRMRLMSAAAAVLSLSICLVAFTMGVQRPLVELGVHGLVLVSGLAFGLALYPPSGVRFWWARPEYQRLQATMISMMQATSAGEVAAGLLPPTVGITGGSGAVLLGADGVVTASYGEAPAVGSHHSPVGDRDSRPDAAEQVIALGDGQGHLVVWTSRYTPFFGEEELRLLHAMAGVATIALERADLLVEETERRRSLELAQERADAARQEATRANLAKTEFLSRMSHELRTPLNAILGFGQLLRGSPNLSDEDRESVDYVLKGGRHLLDLINEVLDLSRIEAGKLSISLEPVLVSELVENAVALVRPMADDRSIRLEVQVAGCAEFARTDRQRSSQVLLNLLSNAVKYNYDGGTVGVACRRTSEDRIRVSVTDTGPGIDESRQPDLFQPFERLGAENSAVEGTGLGLALTKQLVDAMSGQIGVASAPGQGSTFWVELPLTDPPEDAKDVVEQPAYSDTDERGRTLLLVEDNLVNLKLIEAMLRRRPAVSVIPAVQGRLAIELAHQHKPDVIVLDLHLPDLSGQEVLHRLQADPATRHIPVVIASADATPGRIRRLREQGAFDYLTKPLELEPFLAVIDGALASEN